MQMKEEAGPPRKNEVVNQAEAKPVKITFENLEFEINVLNNYSSDKKEGSKVARQKIVKGVSGHAMPG